ncbi:MAG: insulinase family protein, partial [Holophaga sp.]|nr:insulinase family protein [Holophaga sp.]
MRSLIFRLFAPVLVVSLAAQVPEVKERRLNNGFQVLLVERPGTGALHARLMIRAGRADTGALPSAAAEILARTLFRRILPTEVVAGDDLTRLLKQEEGAHEALRLERSRRLRLDLPESSSEELSLGQLHRARMGELRAKVASSSPSDMLENLGITKREMGAEADEMSLAMDLPLASFEPWCRLEQQHFQQLVLARYSIERDIWIEELAKEGQGEKAALSILLGTAFSGHPYAQVFEPGSGRMEGLNWSEFRAYARRILSPERMTLVLVGDLQMEKALRPIQETFGALAPVPEAMGLRQETYWDLSGGPGYRRLQANTTGDPRLLMAWRIPPTNHSDGNALAVLARILGGSKSSRLVRRLEEERGLAGKLSVKVGMPGGRDPSLFLIDAAPAEGHSLAELEEALRGEVLRIQNERFPEEDIHRALRQMEADQLMMQEDAGTLAKALGNAIAQSGDWRQAFRAKDSGRSITADSIQAVAK